MDDGHVQDRLPEDLIRFIAATPDLLAAFLADVSSLDSRWQPATDEFSIIEHICHLRDIEVEGYTERLNRMLGEDRPSMPDLDGGRLAIERDYQRQDLMSSFNAFVSARTGNLQTMKLLNGDQLQREGVLEGVGSLTIAKLLSMMQEHDEGHLDELRSLQRRLRAGQSETGR